MSTKLAFIQPILAPYRRPLFEKLHMCDGIELKVFTLSRGFLHRKSWDVREDEKFNIEVIDNIKIKQKVRITGDRVETGVRVLPVKLLNSLIKFKPDVIICTNTTEYIFSFAYKLFKKVRVGCWVEDTAFIASKKSKLKQLVRGFLFRRMDFWLVNGVASKDYLVSIGVNEESITAAWCSVDNSLYFATTKSSSYRDRKRWISVGALNQRKGHDLLINAWGEQTPEFHANNELFIVGDGPDKDSLMNLANQLGLENVTFTGYKAPDEIPQIYNQSDVFVFPTTMDIWGLVVNEAMASGLPIVCSQYAGCHPDLVGESNGIVIDPYDIEQFANDIGEFERKSSEWKSMGNESMKIIANYTIANTVNSVLKVCGVSDK